MYEYIEGKVAVKRVDYIAIDVSGVAYKIFVSLNTYDKIKSEKERLYIYTYVKEEYFTLYGFYSEEEREFFRILIGVNGVGAKLAIAILSTFTTQDLKFIVSNQEVKKLTKVPGLGAKKAEKLMVDIKDKIKIDFAIDKTIERAKENEVENDLRLALNSLGYKDASIEKVISKEDLGKYSSVEEAIKGILKKLL